MGISILDIARKAASIVLVIFLVLSAIFVTFMVMPGDPTITMVPKTGDTELAERVVQEMRLDQPLFIQFIDYIFDTLTGDFRVSTGVHKYAEIESFIWHSVGNTLALLTLGLLGALGIATVLERFVSRRRGRSAPIVIHTLSLILLSMPAFSLALAVLYLNARLDLGFPFVGDGIRPDTEDGQLVSEFISHAFLPVLIIVLSSAGLAVLLLREGLRTSGQRGRGDGANLELLATGLVRLRPVMHFYVAWTMSVAMAVDLAFSYGGLGQLLWDSIANFDYPTLMATLFLIWMIALGAGMIVSVAVHALAGSKTSDILSDWGRSTSRPGEHGPVTVRDGVSWRTWFGSAWKGYRATMAEMAALTLLIALTVAAILAPVLATVPDPMNTENLEPSMYGEDWRNPLPPSLDPSPYTGLLHPLGTDVVGRDVYSMWLYAARDAVLMGAFLMIGSVTIGLIVGFLAVKTASVGGILARFADFFLTTGARAVVAMPIVGYVAVRMLVLDARSTIMTAPVLLFVFYAWAWMLVFRPVREASKAASRRVSTSWMIPSIAAETLAVAKFAVPLLLIAYLSLPMMGLRIAPDASWGTIVYSAYVYSAFSHGDWHLIIPPLVGMALIVFGLFVVLDRTENAVRQTGAYPSSNL